ncbi:10552_t:CDS:2 [Ambispora gerdemannii]|uniref:10552_t:CDS:1 n=1 Tax=Ambispora gerdemannii TaxID=144530 RepID=A0A9N9GLC3_9GLOM|nr:10552_t:CDS:2 [Ambispora gerdemannii]
MQEHPLGPNYDQNKVASQPTLNLYKNLSKAPQTNEKLLAALKCFLGEKILNSENKPDIP